LQRILKLLEETQVVVEKQVDVVDAVLEYGDADIYWH
jgi:hypothetical protein